MVDNLASFTVDVMSFTVETPGLSASLVKTLQSFVPTSFFTIQAPLPINQMLGNKLTSPPPPNYNPNLSAPKITNCGVAYSGDLSVFSLRMQLGGANSSYLVNEWTDFHAGAFPNRLLQPDGSSAPWGILLSPPLVEALAADGIGEQLGDHTDEFRLTGGISSHWAPESGQPVVNGEFYGDVLIPCRPHYHVTFSSRLMVTTPNMLVSSGSIAWHGDFWDLVACETLAGLSLGLIGAGIGAKLGGPIGAVVGLAIGFAVGFIGGMVVATVYSPDTSSANCIQKSGSFTCTRELNAGIQLGNQALPVDIRAALPSNDGLVLTGSLELPLIPALTHTLLMIDTKPFGYTPLPVSCGNLSFGLLVSTEEMAAQFTHSEATITVRMIDEDGTPRPIPWVTAVRTSADPQNVLPPQSISITPYSDRTVVTIRPSLTPANSTAYFAAPYGVSIAIQAPAGSRNVDIPAIPALTLQDLERLRSDALRKLNDCLAKQRDLGKRGGRFDLEWLVDPPPDGMPIYRLWQVGVLNMQPGEELRAEDMDGRTLGMGHADEHGIARLTVLTGDGPANRELRLHRVAEMDLGHEADLRIKQIELVPRGLISTGGRVQSMATREVKGRRFVALHTTEAVALLDFTFPSSPRAYFRTDAAGVQGITVTDEGLAYWGESSLTAWSFHGAGPLRTVADPPETPPIHRRFLSMNEPADSCGKKTPVTVEYFTSGSTLLIPTPDGSALRCFSAGGMIEA